MRKKCASCGMICFATDKVCSRCGLTELYQAQIGSDMNSEKTDIKQIKIPWWGYIISFVLAVVIEVFALFPVLANIGWRHSAAAAETASERSASVWALILHLPTVLIVWVPNQIIDIFNIFYLFIPFTQIIFWTYFLAYCWKRYRIRSINRRERGDR